MRSPHSFFTSRTGIRPGIMTTEGLLTSDRGCVSSVLLIGGKWMEMSYILLPPGKTEFVVLMGNSLVKS